MTNDRHSRSRPPSHAALRVGVLLGRYPRLNGPELEELLRNFRSLPILDLALMSADDRLAAKLAALRRDHQSRLGPTAASLAARLALGLIMAGGALWWLLS
jgi:hypothetical protein